MSKPLRIAATGFVSESAGSIASANALLLRELLRRGVEIDFFSKASFVDPRPILGDSPAFRFTDVCNARADSLRRRVSGFPVLRFLAERLDTATYHRLLIREVRHAHRTRNYDLFVWFGDYARGRVPGVKNVSFAQGPPGTDARSILSHFETIRALAGPGRAWKLRVLAGLRLSRLGLPPFAFSDHIVVGSEQSRQTLVSRYHIPANSVSALPYPIDTGLFEARPSFGGPLTCLWLGRLVPRKRLDLFLGGARLALERGTDLRLVVVGSPGYVPELARWLHEFPYPDKLEWIPSVQRSEVPELLRRSGVLIQPSEEEDFGSSVAEAQVAGLPVIVGPTNGNRDYLRGGDVCLATSTAEAVCEALHAVGKRLPSWDRARASAEAVAVFSPARVGARFESILLSAAGWAARGGSGDPLSSRDRSTGRG